MSAEYRSGGRYWVHQAIYNKYQRKYHKRQALTRNLFIAVAVVSVLLLGCALVCPTVFPAILALGFALISSTLVYARMLFDEFHEIKYVIDREEPKEMHYRLFSPEELSRGEINGVPVHILPD